jgi:hypothetical protein
VGARGGAKENEAKEEAKALAESPDGAEKERE